MTTIENQTPENGEYFADLEGAEAELEALHQAAFDGEPVAPEAVVAVQAKIGLLQKVREGRAARAAEKKQAEIDARKDAAKAEVSELLASEETNIETLYRAAVVSLDRLATAVETRSDRIRQAAQIYSASGLRGVLPGYGGPLGWISAPTRDDSEAKAYVDPAFYANGSGHDTKFVVENGNRHKVENPTDFVHRAVTEVAKARNLRVDHGRAYADTIIEGQ